MNNLACILTPQTGLEAIVIGVITLIIGKIAFYISMDKEDRKRKEQENPNLALALFATGFILHFVIELVGLNKWYCDKKCMIGIKSLSHM